MRLAFVKGDVDVIRRHGERAVSGDVEVDQKSAEIILQLPALIAERLEGLVDRAVERAKHLHEMVGGAIAENELPGRK